VLEAGAVIGREFDLVVLTSVVALDKPAVFEPWSPRVPQGWSQKRDLLAPSFGSRT